MRKDEALEYRATRQADPVAIKQVDQVQAPLLTKPDPQLQPLKMNHESVTDKEDLSLMEEIGIPVRGSTSILRERHTAMLQRKRGRKVAKYLL